MLYVHGGVLAGESEELIDGVILHNDPAGIQASWAAVDLESDVKQYMVAIGTQPGKFINITHLGTSKPSHSCRK